MKQAKEFLGNQLWVEPTDSTERVDYLVKTAAESGLGWLRIFLIWPWIEEKPGQWDFRVFDDVFNACEKHGIKIKATLTANSGPWHIGTPLLLHSFTGFLGKHQEEAIINYVNQCVTRYASHPALGQWILWNEPSGGKDRTEETIELWREFLQERYNSDLEALNKRWRTGYSTFDEIPFADEVSNILHRYSPWKSYRPFIDDCFFRCTWLVAELSRLKDWVRKSDPKTPLCVNPVPLIENAARAGIDQEAMGAVVDVLGASYHPAWSFTFTSRANFPMIMASGIKKQASHPSVKQVEVSEVQTGNTLNSSTRPCTVEPSELARFYLASIFAGAESVTGWLLNARSYDFEAGDWGLLDDRDYPSARSAMMRKIHDRLEVALSKTGGWKPEPVKAWIGWSQQSQVVELVDCQCQDVPGRSVNDNALGSTLINGFFMQLGVESVVTRLGDIPSDGSGGGIVFLSHVVAWEDEEVSRLLQFAESGGTLVFDATCGRKNSDTVLYRPWPGIMAKKIGLEAVGLESNPLGYEINLMGQTVGKWLLTRMTPDMSPNVGWSPWEDVRYKNDGEPCVWERPYGKGRVVFINGIVGPSVLHEESSHFVTRYIIGKLAGHLSAPVRPVLEGHSAIALHNVCNQGHITAIIAEPSTNRGGQPLRIIAEPGNYEELWTGGTVVVGNSKETILDAEDGIALLFKSQTTQ